MLFVIVAVAGGLALVGGGSGAVVKGAKKVKDTTVKVVKVVIPGK